jgi:hypothetical protein
MNSDRIEGNWTQRRELARRTGGRLTNHQLDVLAGKRSRAPGGTRHTVSPVPKTNSSWRSGKACCASGSAGRRANPPATPAHATSTTASEVTCRRQP